MKNKTKTYILLFTVLAIWGIIGYKILFSINPDIPEVAKNDNTVLFSPKTNADIERFSIQSSNRDPFLGTLYIKKKKSKPKKSKPKAEMVWPSITYHGTISKKDSAEKICVLSINGQQQIMKVGQVAKEVHLLKATNLEVSISYKGKKKTIPKL